MSFIYNILVYVASFTLKLLSLFNSKIKLGVVGRNQTFSTLENSLTNTDKTLWFHCASLGEYEQGLPVFEAIKLDYPDHKIVLSFFSPSGYEIRKNTAIADCVVYLPLDTKRNARRFLDIVNPELTVFVKYDIWPNVLKTLKKRQLRAILISALFRDNQSFFKFYGSHVKSALFAFEHIFTQDENSKIVLNRIGYTAVTVSGDTRFDRVSNQLKHDNTLSFIESFKGKSTLTVIGSSWPEDEKLIINYINTKASDVTKFIIAPHNIKTKQIQALKQQINKKAICYSEKQQHNLNDYSVFILDTIGLLSKVYSYADIAYVGGAMGHTGLHNTLEPAVFGIPIVIGKHYANFPEAKNMIENNGLFSISNEEELHHIMERLVQDSNFRHASGQENATFIKKNTGAVVQIMNYIRR